MAGPDVLRIVVLLLGGAVVGIGSPILWRRTWSWRHMGYRAGARAAWLLAVVNALVLVYVAFDVAGRQGDPVSWRTPFALVIFATKAWMLLSIRQASLDIEQRLAVEGKLDRRGPDRRRASRRLTDR